MLICVLIYFNESFKLLKKVFKKEKSQNNWQQYITEL